jgi:hypothetical protein
MKKNKLVMKLHSNQMKMKPPESKALNKAATPELFGV